MKTVLSLISIYGNLISCAQSANNDKSSSVFIKKDSLGRTLEKWGNENTWDNDVNFRSLFKYNENGFLIEEMLYLFEDDNIECKIININDYIKMVYIYDEYNNLESEQKYYQVYGKNGEVIDHKLGYIYNYKTNFEKVID